MELQQEFNALVSQYQQIYGGALVELDGKQLTLSLIHIFRTGLEQVSWPGRFELLRHSPAFVLDGSHNAHGMRATVQSQMCIRDRRCCFLPPAPAAGSTILCPCWSVWC